MTDQITYDQSPPDIKSKILKLQEPERSRQIALWACVIGFDDLRPKPLPTRPEKVVEYYNLSDRERRKMSEDPGKYSGFWWSHDVKKYFDDRFWIKQQNKDNKEWLEKIKGWLNPDTDQKQIDMITERLYEFQDEIVIPEDPHIRKVRDIFESEEE